MIHTAFFSCAELNAYIMIIYKSSHKSHGGLVTHARKFYEEEKIGSLRYVDYGLRLRLNMLLRMIKTT